MNVFSVHRFSLICLSVFIFSCLLAYFLFFSHGEGASSATTNEQVTISRRAVNFGVVSAGDMEAEQLLSVVNMSGKAVKIESVYMSCGCIDYAVLGRYSVPAEGKRDIRVFIDQERIREGMNASEMIVTFEDKSLDPLRVQISYTYVDLVNVSSKTGYLGQVDLQSSGIGNSGFLNEWRTTIEFERGADAEIDKIESDADYLDLSFERLGTTTVEVLARLRDDAPLGQHRAAIMVYPSATPDRPIKLMVYTQIFGVIQVKPSKLIIREFDHGGLFQRELVCQMTESAQIRAIRVNRPFLTAELLSAKQNELEARIRVTGQITEQQFTKFQVGHEIGVVEIEVEHKMGSDTSVETVVTPIFLHMLWAPTQGN